MQTTNRRPAPKTAPKIPAHHTAPRVQAAPPAPARKIATQPKVPVTRPKVPVQKTAPKVATPKAYVADLALVPAELEPLSPAYVESLGPVRAMTVLAPPSDRSLAEARGYQTEDLYSIAEIGYHYLMSGGLKLAQTLFEGLVAVCPTEPYFVLALGLTYDRLDEKALAEGCYREALRLDPKDGRAEINLAELHIEKGEMQRAVSHLERGRAKALAGGEDALARKADALLAHVSR